MESPRSPAQRGAMGWTVGTPPVPRGRGFLCSISHRGVRKAKTLGGGGYGEDSQVMSIW